MKYTLFFAVTLFFVSCTDAGEGSADSERDTTAPATGSVKESQEMKEERNKQIALASIEAFVSGNADSVLATMAETTIDYGEGSNPPMTNRDSIRMGMKAWMNAVPDYKATDIVAVADGDYVVVYATWTGTWQKDFMGMKATGKKMKYIDADVFKFDDAGKITEHRSTQSMNMVANQVGMKMK